MPKEPTIIENCINNLRALVQKDIQSNWYFSFQDISVDRNILNANITKFESKNWQLAEVNNKGYITWNKGREVRWLAQKITIPYTLKDYPLSGLTLRLVLTWWAEDAQIFVNGKLVQQGDLFNSSARVILTNSAIPGDEFLVTIRLVSPGHDIGALMRSKCVYERNQKSEFRSQNSVGKVDELSLLNSHTIDPGFVADEIDILAKYLTRF